MKRPFPFASLGLLNYAGRLLITLFAICVLLLALHMVRTVEKLLLDSQNGLKNMPPIHVAQPTGSILGDPSVHPFWPEFPHSDAGLFQSAVINGVQTMTEQWQCNASSDEVLSYYRDQMTARGWQDDTEKTYGGDPKMHQLGAVENIPEDQQAITTYRNTMDTELVLKRDEWSLHISTEPAGGLGQIVVKFFAAATPSIENLFMGMSSAFAPNKEAGGRPLDVQQVNGNDHYDTTITTKNESPVQAFQAALADFETKGWRPAMTLPQQQTRPGFFAWLTKGRQYGALTVSALPQGGGSSVTFVQVTPE